jgi:hypothetical protein
MLLFHLGFHLVTGGINLYLTLRNSKAGEVQNCIDKTDNATHTDANITKDVCEKAVTFARALSVVPFVITCLLELCACGGGFSVTLCTDVIARCLHHRVQLCKTA